MKLFATFLFSALLLGFSSLISADEPKKELTKEEIIEKLLGKWEIVKADGAGLEGGTITFEKGGKFTLVLKEDSKMEGTFEIEKGRLVTKIGDASDTDTIKKLTADEVELQNDNKETTQLKKKK
ncbi:hypothetical protein KIH39_18920 [Telmatocola sphagniphila]|jgi:uncharacterized protein (TIGR03066 family)|uniref:TIGR03066 family protein n=1 Tax=Telmatocola sphagniphila TaxID=1123043 RepID=A0A8E6B415_9BACT|nr:hypothetical protein [Telmatocola sphagniphila]QVL30909.1 hypothetical protein KIH39_18920 [Telmatocola sphagniphila]